MQSTSRVSLALAAGFAALLVAAAARADGPVAQNDSLNATLWVSNAVEYKANTLAMFALARIRLDEALADTSWSATGQTDASAKPPAIIMDADETILDNSPYEAWLVKSGQDYSGKTWNAWVAAREARAVPGAVAFTQYADSKGVKVFYVTNRTEDQEADTRANMEALRFPMGGKVDTFLMNKEQPDWTGRKGTRREFVGKDYRVLLLFGDNYGDFSDDFGGSEADRAKSLEANIAHIGHDWIFIANPEYGSFECAPFLCDYKTSPDSRRQAKIDALPAWSGPTP
jgi:acid phosphatase